ncbi:MAG: hypothetical protein JWO97_4597 [Acidobacteria bacterium]|nr:hypothetical protein [Acidobacteriota bacterium]
MTSKSLAAIAFTFLLTISAVADEGIISRNAHVRAEPRADAASLRVLQRDEEVEVLDNAQQNGFLHIQTEDGIQGWVFGKFVRSAPPAQTVLPAAAATASAAATSISPKWEKPEPVVKSFTLDGKTCGVDGSGDKRDKGTNRRKNRIDIPASYHDVTWKAIAELDYPTPSPKSREDFSPEQLAAIEKFEGPPIRTVGYVVAIKPQAGNSESCNCGWHGEKATDWHIALVEHPGDGEATSVVMEPTPRIKKDHPNWTKTKLSPWLDADVPVRISGWLLFDPQHRNHLKKYRSTLWEIHPITKIEVWDADAEKWVDLDHINESD